MRKLCFQTHAIAFCLLFLSCFAQAQFRASLRGVVTDPQGALVQGATVTLLNTQTNASMTSVTDDNGIYVFNGLPSAPFRITVARNGFKQKVIENVQIIPEQLNSLDLRLELGQVQETVRVSGTTQTLDTETATVSGTIRNEQVQNMPSFGRDVFQLIQLAPGVFGDGAQGGGGGSANLPGTQGPGATGGNNGIFQTENGPQALAMGQQYENNGISIDGISTTSAVWGGTTIITPSEESVDNVKVVTNNYDAELGRFSGAQVQVTSKSGTNQYHGSLFFTAHRPGLNAHQPFNGTGNKDLRDNNFFNQFGGSVGGPIWKNKIFGFFSYETVRTPAGATSINNGWYETSAFDGAARANSIASKYLTFPGAGVNALSMNNSTCADAGLVENVNCRTIPGKGLDIGSPLTSPLGTQDPAFTSAANPGLGGGLDGVADIANFVTSSKNSSTKVQYNSRVDANITTKDRLAFTMYWVPQSSNFLNGPARAYNNFNHSQINDAFALIWDRTLSTTLLNEFRVNAAGWRWNEITSNPQAPVGLPHDQVGGIGSINLQSFGPNVGSILNQWTYSLKDVATKVSGRHTVKFGGEVTRLYYLNACIGCGVPNYGFFNIWDFLNDAPHQESSGFDPHTGIPTAQRQDDRENLWALFVQDDFKLRRNLTLNLGLRYSYFGPLYSKENNMYMALPGAGSAYMTGLTVQKGNAWNPQKNNFGPQIGFAWSPGRLKDRLVVRGGYGLSYSQEEIAIGANVNANPGLIVFPTFSMATPSSPNPGIVYATASDVHSLSGYPSNPNAIVTFGSNGLPTSGTVNVGIFPNRTLPTMHVHHFSLDTQYDLGHDLVATLGYQGSISRNLYFHESPNALPAALGYQLNPQIGGGDYWSLLGYANYNAMIAGLKHRFSHQFMVDTQFTWAKSMDTSSGPYFEQPYVANVAYNYGRSDYNVGKAFKIYGMWQPVIFHGQKGWLEKVVGGWTISPIYNIHSGFPWTPLVSVVGGNLYCGTCGYGTLFPAAYLGGAASSTSNDAFKTGANYPNGGAAYFSTPVYTAYTGSNFGSANPPAPGVGRNSLNGPGYKDVDLSLLKAFGLPTMPVLGESAKLEFRVDAYNLFNNLNFKGGGQSYGGSIVDNINAVGFGRATQGLAGRVVTLGARFNF
jgi:hypothetical protein